MILTYAGPVNPMETRLAKLFASGYALDSGVVLLTLTAILFAPVLHRIIHGFHLQLGKGDHSDEEAERSDRSPQ
jgi:hypothetical protein